MVNKRLWSGSFHRLFRSQQFRWIHRQDLEGIWFKFPSSSNKKLPEDHQDDGWWSITGNRQESGRQPAEQQRQILRNAFLPENVECLKQSYKIYMCWPISCQPWLERRLFFSPRWFPCVKTGRVIELFTNAISWLAKSVCAFGGRRYKPIKSMDILSIANHFRYIFLFTSD